MFKRENLKYLVPISSLFFSFKIFLGTILGYLISKVYTEFLVSKFKLPPSIFLPLFNFKLKLHHWISASLLLVFSFLFEINFFLKPLPLGCLVGIIWHDFQTDKEVFKIIFKKNELN